MSYLSHKTIIPHGLHHFKPHSGYLLYFNNTQTHRNSFTIPP